MTDDETNPNEGLIEWRKRPRLNGNFAAGNAAIFVTQFNRCFFFDLAKPTFGTGAPSAVGYGAIPGNVSHRCPTQNDLMTKTGGALKILLPRMAMRFGDLEDT